MGQYKPEKSYVKNQLNDLINRLTLDEILMIRDLVLAYLKINKNISFENNNDKY